MMEKWNMGNEILILFSDEGHLFKLGFHSTESRIS
jgi:hypothetical protein